MESYFTENGIGSNQALAEQWQAIQLAVCGPTTPQLIRSLSSPAKPPERTYIQANDKACAGASTVNSVTYCTCTAVKLPQQSATTRRINECFCGSAPEALETLLI